MKRKRRILNLILNCALICLLITGCGKDRIAEDSESKEPEKVTTNESQLVEESFEQDEEDIEVEKADEIIESAEAVSLLDRLGRGINIGNSLDCFDEWNDQAVVTETYWGNPQITEEYVRVIINSGFNTIRIPVTWSPHVHDNKIDDDFMNRVKEVVDYAYNSGANVIIDIHHDRMFAPSYGNYNFAKEYLERIWGQVAEEFKDYDDRLIFEGINEPRFYGSADEWTEGTAEGADNVNKLMADFVNVVRSSGGNNSTRLLLVTCYCNRSGGPALDRLILPEDSNIAISIHSYDPYEFTSSGNYREFDDELKWQFDATIRNLKMYMEKNHIPIVITECGTYESVGKSGRLQYLNYVLTKMDEAGIPCVWWDNGNGYGYGAYGLFDRYGNKPYDQEYVDAITKEN